MSMTKTDYELIAETLDRIVTRQAEQTETYIDVCEALADAFEADNPKFNRDKFLKACGIDG